MSKRLEQTLHKGRSATANKHIKKCPTFVIREIQVNTTMRCHFTPSKMAKIEKTNNAIYGATRILTLY